MEIDAKLQELYQRRFDRELRRRNEIWQVLVKSFFQRYVNESDAVLDVGAGYCEFINNIKCSNKYAVDLNSDVLRFASSGVRAFNVRLSEVVSLLESSVDVVFMSNFLEHLKSKEEVLEILKDVSAVLKPDGILIILQPNIRYAYKQYWDYFDHNIPLSDKSMVEVLQITGFELKERIPRFLPYTTKSRIPQWGFLIKAYLKVPLIWRIMGKQMLLIAQCNKKEKT